MHTHNETVARATLNSCMHAAADVERWPRILPHYREVRFDRREGFGVGRVYMSAFRHFGQIPYPIWWVSEMMTDVERGIVRYRHVDGITTGMDVEWRLWEQSEGTRIVIIHSWAGPPWPGIGSLAAEHIIGPHFIHVVADRTLAGIRRSVETEASAALEADGPAAASPASAPAPSASQSATPPSAATAAERRSRA